MFGVIEGDHQVRTLELDVDAYAAALVRDLAAAVVEREAKAEELAWEQAEAEQVGWMTPDGRLWTLGHKCRDEHPWVPVYVELDAKAVGFG